MKTIVIEKGKYEGDTILVDDEDYPLVSQYRWYILANHGCKYATAKINGVTVFMHRMIANPPDGLVVDHINFNGLDNRRENMRVVTLAENSKHNSARTKPRSGYRGVYPDGLPGRCGWYVKVGVNGRKVYVGHYLNEVEAARAYDHAAKQLHGEYAVLNFP